MKILEGHWSVFHVNKITQQLQQKALDDHSEGKTYRNGVSHAKGQIVGVSVFLGVAVILLILLKLA